VTDGDRPLDVYADLTLEVGDASVAVRGYGDLVVVAAPTLSAVRELAGGGLLLERLVAADVTVDLRVRGLSVARAGPDHPPGLLSRRLGLAPVRLEPGGLFLAALTRPP
jgi:hypothetical protein